MAKLSKTARKAQKLVKKGLIVHTMVPMSQADIDTLSVWEEFNPETKCSIEREVIEGRITGKDYVGGKLPERYRHLVVN